MPTKLSYQAAPFDRPFICLLLVGVAMSAGTRLGTIIIIAAARDRDIAIAV